MLSSTQKQFILDTLVPYFEDPTTVSYDKENNLCYYVNPENGNKCAVGKHMYNHFSFKGNVKELFDTYDKKEVLTKEAFNQNLDNIFWFSIQGIHDTFASKKYITCLKNIEVLEEIGKTSFSELKDLLKKYTDETN